MGRPQQQELLQRDWVLVELQESGPIALEESEAIRADEEEMKPISGTNTYYISYGIPGQSPPNNFLGTNWSETDINRPKAILVISPGWKTSKPAVCVASKLPNLHVNGIPSKNSEITYTAPRLARRVKELLMKAGIMESRMQQTAKHMDRVSLIPLYFIPPNVDVPVCQLSIQPHQDGVYHYNVGRALSSLKDEGILVVGSSISCNDFASINLQTSNRPTDWDLAFDSWLKDCMANNRLQEIMEFDKSNWVAVKGRPLAEELYALLVVLGAAGEEAKAMRVPEGWKFGYSAM